MSYNNSACLKAPMEILLFDHFPWKKKKTNASFSFPIFYKILAKRLRLQKINLFKSIK